MTDVDEDWAREKRLRRYLALKEDGEVFGLVPSEEIEFAHLSKEFSSLPSGEA